MGKHRVVIVDEQPIVLHGLSQLLASLPEFEIVGSFTDSSRAYFHIMEVTPDLVIFDLEHSGRGTIDLANKVASPRSRPWLVLYSDHVSDVFIDVALRLPAAGYLVKTEPLPRVAHALQRIARGESVYSEQIMDRLLFDRKSNTFQLKTQCQLASLTLRQLQVLRQLAQGDSVKQVAESMSISERAVESHKYRIMQKMGIHDRVVLTRYAIREGLLQP